MSSFQILFSRYYRFGQNGDYVCIVVRGRSRFYCCAMCCHAAPVPHLLECSAVALSSSTSMWVNLPSLPFGFSPLRDKGF